MKIRNERKEDTMEIKVIYWIIFTEQNLTEIKKKLYENATNNYMPTSWVTQMKWKLLERNKLSNLTQN